MNAREPQVALIPPASLILATRRLLRPLVRLLMAHGVGFPYLSGLVKAVFVDVAAHDFPEADGSTTDSRVSLLSGVHRREVKRLRNEVADFGAPASVSMGAQIVARWCAEDRYLDSAGQPAKLSRLAKSGGEVSFEALVASVSKDIRARAVLDEWLNLGVAELDSEDCVCLKHSAFIPAQGFGEKAFYLGKGAHDHLAAASHNLLGMTPTYPDRMAYYDGLSPESVVILRELAQKQIAAVLQEFNRQALALQAADEAKGTGTSRVTLGAYFYAHDE